MPRARSWDSTMAWRSAAKTSGSGFTTICGQDTPVAIGRLPQGSPASARGRLWLPAPGHAALLLEPAEADVDAHHTVQIADGADGNVASHVVLRLDDLLRSLRHGGAVGERESAGDLLLDGHLGAAGKVGFCGAQSLGIDFDTADAEQFLHTIADGGIEGFSDDGVRSPLSDGGLPRLLQLSRFFLSAPEREQGDDVGFRQRRLGTVSNVEAVGLAGIASDRQRDVVVADTGGSLEVEDGSGSCGVGESNAAALQAELCTIEEDLAFQNIGTPQNHGFRRSAAEAQIGVSGQTHAGSLHLEFRGGDDMNVELDAIEQRVGLGQSALLRAEGAGEVESGSNGKPVDSDVAGKGGSDVAAHPMQLRIGG